eukprot:TRINITY_DN5042_c0_g1_i3.p1 TRINITY_DN5042_c0_g1~~TRINITY_DN5042_c0_g1_i3.p1  ORF type:complete len:210 (+),score=83.93 TRINITY_DN5042_c0_g1_i3:519-1148(+)
MALAFTPSGMKWLGTILKPLATLFEAQGNGESKELVYKGTEMAVDIWLDGMSLVPIWLRESWITFREEFESRWPQIKFERLPGFHFIVTALSEGDAFSPKGLKLVSNLLNQLDSLSSDDLRASLLTILERRRMEIQEFKTEFVDETAIDVCCFIIASSKPVEVHKENTKSLMSKFYRLCDSLTSDIIDEGPPTKRKNKLKFFKKFGKKD